MKIRFLRGRHPWLLLLWVILIAFFFAEVEIQIEGADGWAAKLPTWRIESHWLLDIFWGGRPMTGYHAWVFSFMALIFHFPIFLRGHWDIKIESRIIGSLMFFWIVEDFIWFLLNPAYGWSKFSPQNVPWHKHWFWLFPTDYLTFTGVGLALYWFSFRRLEPLPPEDHSEDGAIPPGKPA